MPFVNFRKKFRFFSFFWAYAEPNFFDELSKIFFFKIFTMVLLDGFLYGFLKFRLFIVQICILNWYFWVFFKNYSVHMLSIRGNDLSHAEHTRNRFHRTLSIRGTNFCTCSASGKLWTVFACTIHAEHTQNEFYWKKERKKERSLIFSTTAHTDKRYSSWIIQNYITYIWQKSWLIRGRY
jgi:hypothetical protein